MNGRLERQLVSACRDGDTSAYSGLVRAYSGRVFAICLGIVGNRQDAEDIAQQALLKGLSDIKQLRRGEQFGAWISRIAKNLCLDFLRRQKHRVDALPSNVTAEASSTKEYAGLEAALAKLPQDYRVALMLYYFDGQSGEAIAEALEISPAAVHKRLSRAKQQLRQLLEAEGGA